MASLCDVGRQRYDWLRFVKTCECEMVALKVWMTFLSTSGTQLPLSAMVCHYVAKSFLDFAEALPRRPLSPVSVAKQSHRQQTYTAPLKHAAWFEDLTLCTRILPDRNTWTFSLPCLSFMVEMQSVAKSWILNPLVKLQVVSIWKKVETFTCGVIPLALIANATQQKQWYTAERDETAALFYLLNLFLTVRAHSFLAGSQVLHLRPRLVPSLQHVLSKCFCLYPLLKLQMPCPKKQGVVKRQHCMLKILFVSLGFESKRLTHHDATGVDQS